MRFWKRKRNRACVVGLDGVPIGLLQRLAAEGIMPRTAAIISGGGLRAMRASLPPISSVSWSCFMTGANPAEHGIFGFTDVAPGSYQLRFPTFSDLAVPTFWDELGKKGRRCAVLNQPATYPAREFPGALVSGFVALQLSHSVWPKSHLPALEQIGYRIDVDSKRARENPDGLLDDLEATLRTRRQAAGYFWKQEEWDYFQVVVTGTDRLHHFLWHALEDANDPRHKRVMRYYHTVDEFIGGLWDRFHEGRSGDREGEGFVMLSDHGFTALRRDVRLNAWLRDNGYLSYAVDEPTSIADIDPENTRAFALDPGRIHINTRGRFAGGSVATEDVLALRQELAERLASLACEGEPVIERVFTREEAFRGPKTELAADLVLISHDGFDLKGTTKGEEVFAPSHFQGMHTWRDAFLWTLLPMPDDPEVSDPASRIREWVLG
ncbi:MAG: alkaline phosphatase family protein [Armatimonadetes bacterium]|nr:alkaline phosphatase family protein [Armatimonadota bacterium]